MDAAASVLAGVNCSDKRGWPQVLVHDDRRNWLILVDSLEGRGPINPKRLFDLKTIFANATPGLVFVTAFEDRRTMSRYLGDIAWETEVWIADAPDHLIHFNGERFLGPYEQKTNDPE
jgi:type II restriction enzyme